MVRSDVYLVHTSESGCIGQAICSLVDPRRACRKEEWVQMRFLIVKRDVEEKDVADRWAP